MERVFDHVGMRTADFAATGRAYRLLMAAVGAELSADDDDLLEFDDADSSLDLSPVDDGHPVTRHVHVGVKAPSHAAVDAFWRAGREAGLEDDGPPGLRPQYAPDYYGAFLRDLDGNSIEACVHGAGGGPGVVDHVWLRVRDLAASTAFYGAVAAQTGFALVHEEPGYARFRGGRASFSLVAGSPVSEALHLAFRGADDATVDAFHAAALVAGAQDNGAPGERPEYHPGYYGAFVLDPDGHNVEVVCHNR